MISLHRNELSDSSPRSATCGGVFNQSHRIFMHQVITIVFVVCVAAPKFICPDEKSWVGFVVLEDDEKTPAGFLEFLFTQYFGPMFLQTLMYVGELVCVSNNVRESSVMPLMLILYRLFFLSAVLDEATTLSMDRLVESIDVRMLNGKNLKTLADVYAAQRNCSPHIPPIRSWFLKMQVSVAACGCCNASSCPSSERPTLVG